MPSHRKPKPFETAKAIAYFEFLWQRCKHRECKKRKRCTGGPRGTQRKFDDVPFCRIEGNLKEPIVWVADW